MLKNNGKLVPLGGGDPIDLYGDTIIIGRRPSCDIRMEFPNISGHHCKLTFREGFWFLEDLESRNGTKVNGNRILANTSILIQPGAEIVIGKRPFKVEYLTTKPLPSHLDNPIVEDFSTSLLQKAGLERSRDRQPKESRQNIPFDPADFLLDGDDLD